MNGKRALRAAQWQRHITAWRSSGQTQTAYCAAHGLSVSALGYWIGRFHKDGNRSDGARLTLVAAQPSATLMGPQAGGAELTLRSPSGWALVFGNRPPAAWLRKLLAAEQTQ